MSRIHTHYTTTSEVLRRTRTHVYTSTPITVHWILGPSLYMTCERKSRQPTFIYKDIHRKQL